MRRILLLGLVSGFLLSPSSFALAQLSPDSSSRSSQRSAQDDPLANGPLIWDYNHDGVYTCDEWKRYADQLFTLADRNRDGFLDTSEFPTIRRAERTFADADLDYFDDNRDGKISRSEFVDKPSLFITRFDKNVDCRVTPDELKGGTPSQKRTPEGEGGRRGGPGGLGPKF